jgi:hypothetical protein
MASEDIMADSDTELGLGRIANNDDDTVSTSIDTVEYVTVEFPIGYTLREYKLVQIEDYPVHRSKVIIADGDIAVIISKENVKFQDRGHFDGHRWGKMSKGKQKKLKIGSYNCVKKSDGCKATKRKWICDGKCPFENNFCCTYSLADSVSLVCVYSYQHNHEHDFDSESISVTEFQMCASDSPTMSTPRRKSNKVSAHVASTPNTASNDSGGAGDLTEENYELGMNEIEIQEILKLSMGNKKFDFQNSKILVTQRAKIQSVNMNDTFHIIEKNDGNRAFDAGKDGFEYKRATSSKSFPQIFKNQQVNRYECLGRRKCVNSNCPIVKRISTLSYVINKPDANQFCPHCSHQLVEDKCSGQKFIIHEKSTRFIVVYYSLGHSCGDQDWVLDPRVIEDLTALFETNDTATSAIAYKKLFEDKLRVALNANTEASKAAHIEDLISVVNSCAHEYVPKNVKAKVIQSKTPQGKGIEAVRLLKESTGLIYNKLGIVIVVVIDSYVCATCKCVNYAKDENEKLVTECCNNSMVNTGPVILVTNRDNMQAAVEMSKPDGLFKSSTVHIDHQPGRCKTMDTMNVAFYDHTLQEMASLFVTHSTGENQFNVFFEIKLFEITLQDIFGNEFKFDPFGFTSDNAGGITAGIRLFFGPGKPHRTCRFHIIFCGYQHCGNAIGSKHDQIIFLRYLFSLIDASTATLFVKISEEFYKWILELPSRKKQLEKWWEFWFGCRAMWSSAFANQSLSEVSLVEALQSKYSKKNNLKNLALYQSVVYSMADYVKYSKRLAELGKGKYIGQGPSSSILESREMYKEMERVKTIPLTGEDFEVIFKNLGLPYNKSVEENEKDREKHLEHNDGEDDCYDSPIAKEKSARHNVTANFSPSPIAKHTFKKRAPPKARKALGIDKVTKKPGRPAKSKSKSFVSRFSNPFTDSSSEDEDTQLLENYIAMEDTQLDEILFKLPEPAAPPSSSKEPSVELNAASTSRDTSSRTVQSCSRNVQDNPAIAGKTMGRMTLLV